MCSKQGEVSQHMQSSRDGCRLTQDADFLFKSCVHEKWSLQPISAMRTSMTFALKLLSVLNSVSTTSPTASSDGTMCFSTKLRVIKWHQNGKYEQQKKSFIHSYFTMCKTLIFLSLSGAYELLQKACEWINEYQRSVAALSSHLRNVIKNWCSRCRGATSNNGAASQSTLPAGINFRFHSTLKGN